MGAADIIQGLLKLATVVHDAFARGSTAGGPGFDWATFFKGEDFKRAEGVIADLAKTLASSNIKAALEEIDAKQSALLKGRAVSQLSVDELVQFSTLSRARLVLTTQDLANAMNEGFLTWLANEALPTLVDIAPVVLPLLL